MIGHSSWASIRRRRNGNVRREPPRARPPRSVEAVRYEGYGPGGAAVLIEGLTSDRDRLGAQVRGTFAQHGGHLGAEGSVSYLFNTVGLMTFPAGVDQERLMQVALEAGAEDVLADGDESVEVLADPLELETVCAVLTHHGFAPATAEVTRRSTISLALSGAPAERMVELLEALDGLEGVRNVYSNVEVPDEVLAGR
ncbi:MAG TPA: YebC/PmpR family DNA-binding transcriptional regulator [Steroidobacteraceae bacterium]|nr:YebC/PmpR family DNA-binding transcriptional regulator [Steroidobacteraceae bacterium]